jgi:hypothetical protein
VARSIKDWFADHERDQNVSSEDEFVEAQQPWDVQSASMATTRSVRRDVGAPNSPKSRRGSSSARGKKKQTAQDTGAFGAMPEATRTAVQSISGTLRRAILTASQANPGASTKSLAASLTRKGTPVSPAQVTAVRRAPTSPLRTGGPVRRDPLMAEKTAKIRHAATTHPHFGAAKLFSLLRSRGITVTENHVTAVLAQLRSTTQGTRQSARSVKLDRQTDVSTAARAGRTSEEAELCSSCGVRPSVSGICRCS